MKNLARTAAVVAVVTLAIGVCMRLAEQFQHSSLPDGFTSSVLAMQMAHSMEEVEKIVGKPGHSDRFQMRSQQFMDFLFVGAYWLEFVLISVLLSWRRSTLTKILALVAVLCVTRAALFDIRENLTILAVLSVPTTPEYDPLTHAVYFAAVGKWTLLAIAMLLLFLVSVGRRDRRTLEGVLFLLLSFSFFATGVVGLLGLGRHAVLEWITIPMVLGLVTLTTILFWFPPKFSQGLKKQSRTPER